MRTGEAVELLGGQGEQIGAGTLVKAGAHVCVVTALHVAHPAAFAVTARRHRISLRRGADFPESDIAILWATGAKPSQLTLDVAEFGFCTCDAVSPGACVSLGTPIGHGGTRWGCVVETVVVRNYGYAAASGTIVMRDAPIHFLSRTAILGASGSSVWTGKGTCLGVVHGNSPENGGRAVVVGIRARERGAIMNAMIGGPTNGGREQ